MAPRNVMAPTPKELSDEDVERLWDVRRAVWSAGMQGGVTGVFLGSTTYVLGKRWIPGSNMFMLFALGGGTLGSFLASVTAGKNAVQRIGDIFRRGAHAVDDPLSKPSQTRLQKITDDNQRDIHDRNTHFLRRQVALDKYRASKNPSPSSSSSSPSEESFYQFQPSHPDPSSSE